MSKVFKKITSVLLCLLLCFFTAVTAAAEEEPPEPKYTYIASTDCSLSISGLNSTSESYLSAKTSTSLKIKMELQKLKSGSYSTVKTWTSTKTGTSLSMEESRLINVLSTYRLKVTFSAGSETVTSYAYP